MMYRWTIIFLILVPTLLEANRRFADSYEYEEWQEFKDFQEWKRTKKIRGDALEDRKFGQFVPLERYYKRKSYEKHYHHRPQGFEDPPPIDQAALMGRYIVNQADWTAVATISSRRETETFPFVNVISCSDGPLGNGSGIPYLYLTPLDFTAQDVSKDHRSTLMMTLAQGDYCKQKVWDPMDPRCARIVLTGKIKPIKNNTAEYNIAKSAMFIRHPWLANMPADHHFFFAKLKIGEIAVLDTFGGPKYVSVQDYLHPPTPNVTTEFLRQFPIREQQNVLNNFDETESEMEFDSYESDSKSVEHFVRHV
ncbi:protein CREG1 [Cephus cinctus]|uniref:Protein CREG1 n=1 Tax=Cephus cinctus TaxID=211228 RepID=A0AAJ7BMT6_CEPCN|nr:protein CREG1 [Cephus cinctus]